jgi:predicted  nucleic acid-binding Zn-ribbon protein
MTSRAGERKRTAEERVEATETDLEELEQELLDEVAEIDERWQAKADEIETIAIRLEATDVRVVETTLVWVPTA